MNRRTKILTASIVTFSVFFAELIGGLLYGSLALVADSFHVIMDVIALFTSFIAIRLASKPSSSIEYTYGYHYLEVIATLFNGATLSVTVFFISYEAIDRLLTPIHLQAIDVIMIAIIGLIANLISARILGPEFSNHNHTDYNYGVHNPINHNHVTQKRVNNEQKYRDEVGVPTEERLERYSPTAEAHSSDACLEEVPNCPVCIPEDMNLKSAYFHVLGDALSSVVVIVGAVIILFTGLAWVDPILALVIAAILFRGTYFILKSSLTTLMGRSPVNIQAVKDFFNFYGEITSVHDLHIWQLCSRVVLLSVHIKTNIDDMNSAELLIETLEENLSRNFNIQHVTIQLETPNTPSRACNICHD